MLMHYAGSILIFLIAGVITYFALVALFEFWRRSRK